MAQFSKEQLELAKKAKSSKQIKDLAKNNGYDIDDKEANSIYEYLQKHGELQDEELTSVSGGGCTYNSGDKPKFSLDQEVFVNEGVGNWFPCVITWVSTEKTTYGLIFKDHEFTYNVRYTTYKTGKIKEGVAEEYLDTETHPVNPHLP